MPVSPINSQHIRLSASLWAEVKARTADPYQGMSAGRTRRPQLRTCRAGGQVPDAEHVAAARRAAAGDEEVLRAGRLAEVHALAVRAPRVHHCRLQLPRALPETACGSAGGSGSHAPDLKAWRPHHHFGGPLDRA
jgi:hypothetical protein